MLPLTEGVKKLLIKLREERKEKVLFTSIGGKDMNRYAFYGVFKRLCKKVDIDGVSVHTLRKTFISNAIMEGADPIRIMAIVGHQNWETIKRYLALSKHYVCSPVELPFREV